MRFVELKCGDVIVSRKRLMGEMVVNVMEDAPKIFIITTLRMWGDWSSEVNTKGNVRKYYVRDTTGLNTNCEVWKVEDCHDDS